MKISINIEKKHLYFLLIILVFLGVGVAIASTWDNSQSHDTLWTSIIRGKNVNSISVYDNIAMQPTKSITADSILVNSLNSAGALAMTFNKDVDMGNNILRFGQGTLLERDDIRTTQLQATYLKMNINEGGAGPGDPSPPCDITTRGLITYQQYSSEALVTPGLLLLCKKTGAFQYDWVAVG